MWCSMPYMADGGPLDLMSTWLACRAQSGLTIFCSLQGELMRLELNNAQLAQSKDELEAQKGRLSDDTQQLSAAKHGIAKVGIAKLLCHPPSMVHANIVEDLPAAAGLGVDFLISGWRITALEFECVLPFEARLASAHVVLPGLR